MKIIKAAKNSSNISPAIVVMEGDNLRLRCAAEGYPKPKGNLIFLIDKIYKSCF